MPPPKGNQPELPEWWKALRVPPRLADRLLSKFTLTRDGYVLWYAGKTRRAAPKSLPPAEVDAAWEERRKAIDAAAANPAAPAKPTRYREVAAEFLNVQKARIGAKRNRLSERSYRNYADALGAFGRFKVDDEAVADMPIRDIGPNVFSGYARQFGAWKASGFDSVVSRVCALFRWAEGQEYVKRFNPGREFRRPAKQDIRDERIELAKSFTPAEVAALYVAATPTMRCWIGLGLCAAFTNADLANLPRGVIDLSGGVIDYRRRKTGKVRRVIPLPADVAELLRAYQWPVEPRRPEWADLFFLTEYGRPYSRTVNDAGEYKPSCSVSRLFAKLMGAAGVGGRGRNFTSLRTTMFNLAPKHDYDLERKIIMGRAKGSVDLDHYLEDVGMDRLRFVVNHVWDQARTEIAKASAGNVVQSHEPRCVP